MAQGSLRATWRDMDCHSHAGYLVKLVESTEGAAVKVFVAGATGAIGKRLVPRLVAGGPPGVG